MIIVLEPGDTVDTIPVSALRERGKLDGTNRFPTDIVRRNGEVLHELNTAVAVIRPDQTLEAWAYAAPKGLPHTELPDSTPMYQIR